MRPCQNAITGCRPDGDDGVEVLQALDAPAQRVAERVDQRIASAAIAATWRRFSGTTPVSVTSTSKRRSEVASSRSCLRFVTSEFSYMPLYCGPPPPSGGTQVITA